MPWKGVDRIARRSYTCGHCGNDVGPDQAYSDPSDEIRRIFVCPACDCPTYFAVGIQIPGAPYGNDVGGVPEDVYNLYQQARQCMSVSSHTSVVLTCRKILMHIAVEQGADEGKSFLNYAQYLARNHYVPPGASGWVDHIRKKGNEANHEIVTMGREDAENLIDFIEILLKNIYEFPSRIPKDEEQEGPEE